MVKMNTDKGYIRISNDVFTTLVGAAATSCFGVRAWPSVPPATAWSIC